MWLDKKCGCTFFCSPSNIYLFGMSHISQKLETKEFMVKEDGDFGGSTTRQLNLHEILIILEVYTEICFMWILCW